MLEMKASASIGETIMPSDVHWRGSFPIPSNDSITLRCVGNSLPDFGCSSPDTINDWWDSCVTLCESDRCRVPLRSKRDLLELIERDAWVYASLSLKALTQHWRTVSVGWPVNDCAERTKSQRNSVLMTLRSCFANSALWTFSHKSRFNNTKLRTAAVSIMYQDKIKPYIRSSLWNSVGPLLLGKSSEQIYRCLHGSQLLLFLLYIAAVYTDPLKQYPLELKGAATSE